MVNSSFNGILVATERFFARTIVAFAFKDTISELTLIREKANMKDRFFRGNFCVDISLGQCLFLSIPSTFRPPFCVCV